MLAVGVVAAIIPQTTTFAADILIGVLLAVGGVIGTASGLISRNASDSAENILIALLALGAGVLLLVYPVADVVGLPLFLATFYLTSGVLRIFYGVMTSLKHDRRWTKFGGVLSIGLAILLWLAQPDIALWALGMIVGVDLIFFGIVLASAAVSTVESVPPRKRP